MINAVPKATNESGRITALKLHVECLQAKQHTTFK